MFNFLNQNTLIEKTWAIVLFLTMDPESPVELLAGLILGLLAVSVVLAKAHTLGGTRSGSIIVGLFVTALGVFGMIQIAVLSDMLLLPLMDKQYWPFAYGASIIVGFMIMLIPFTRTLFRAGYGASFLAWIVAIAVGAGVMMGVDYYFADNSKEDPSIRAVGRYINEVKGKVVAGGEKIKDKVDNKEQKPSSPDQP